MARRERSPVTSTELRGGPAVRGGRAGCRSEDMTEEGSTHQLRPSFNERFMAALGAQHWARDWRALAVLCKKEFYNKTPSHDTGHGTGAHWH